MPIEIMRREYFSYEKYEKMLAEYSSSMRDNRKCDPVPKSEESLEKMEYEMRKAEREQSVVEQSMRYAEKLCASRNKSKATSLDKKRVQYNFKKISSLIIRSKNSMSARKAVQAARHEVLRLNRLKGSDKYDAEELQLAIDHAKSMEKVAKKKVHHLEQEEMIERGSGTLEYEIEEPDDKSELNEEEEPEEELTEGSEQEDEALSEEEYEDEMYIEDAAYESMSAYQYASLMEANDDSMTDMMEELTQEMMSMIEELDLTDLAETMCAPNPHMSESEFKILKIKHRTKEMKEIAEADKEYLKGVFEHEKAKADETASIGRTSGETIVFKADDPGIAPVVPMPEAPAGGFDVSL
ncbi:MAG: hypothetical protein J5802_00150 [Butyrivibrio sp.]|nr:hypothetical protein [Butyrivibrio sp.]